MAKRPAIRPQTNYEKDFINFFSSLCQARSAWQVWSDFITMSACSLANSVDKDSEHYAEREKEYDECLKRMGGVEAPAKLFTIVVEALEDNPDQDFLGTMFMELGLNNHWKGQFFTPFCVCRTMAALTFPGTEQYLNEHGWASTNDPTCGAGALLIARATVLRENNVDYHNKILFVAQDIDRIAGLMCYIQLSLLGCAGYVVIGNTLTHPAVGPSVLFPVEDKEQEIWFMPMYANEIWTMRRQFNKLDLIFSSFKSNACRQVPEQKEAS